MVIDSLSEVALNDLERRIWNSLGAFQNVPHTASKIRLLHGIPTGYGKQIAKQAEQLRFCLIQASEYFSAARAVSMATRPLLIYYGIMSLALAEILLKQDGMSSLDAARGEHAHHGLDLRIDVNPSGLHDLGDSAQAIRAVPLVTPKGRKGTFELWHRSAREATLCGPTVRTFANRSTQEGGSVLFIAEDKRLPEVPVAGLSFLDCLQAHPQCAPVLARNKLRTANVRVRARAEWFEPSDEWNYILTVQPSDQEALENAYNLIHFHPEAVNRLKIIDFPSGMGLHWSNNPNGLPLLFRFPAGYQFAVEEFFIPLEAIYLNEFGILYTGMYMLGNYARYFPDQWMKDVESSSPLALAAKEFTDIAEERAPLLALSELDREHYLLP